MKNVKNVVKGLLVGMVVVIGCMVNCNVAKADVNDPNVINHYTDTKGNVVTQYKDGSYYINSDVTVVNKNYIDNTITINKDGQLYSFYVDNAKNYYINEQINITMNNYNEVIDCTVDSNPVVYDNVSISKVDSELVYVNVNGDVYNFDNEEGSEGWQVNDKCKVIIQNNKLLEVRPEIVK